MWSSAQPLYAGADSGISRNDPPYNFSRYVTQIKRNAAGQKLIDQRIQILDKGSDADLAPLMSNSHQQTLP